MAGSVTRLSPSTSFKSSAIRQASESDENEQNYHQMGTVSHTPKKPMSKNYMSPTISASSKAITPRNKILIERNEAESVFSYAHDKTIPIFDQISPLVNSDAEDFLSRTIPSSPPVSQCNNNEEDGLSADLSCRPYDPFTNYLSPRPRFLRYNPNRRRKVLFGGENGTLEVKHGSTASNASGSSDSQRAIDEKDSFNCSSLVYSGENGTPEVKHGSTAAKGSGSSDSQKAIDEEASSNCSSLAFSFSREGPIKQEDKEIEGFNEKMEQSDDEENEDEEDDRSWNCKGILKTLLLLVVLVLSASCISSMHSSTTIQDGYYTTQNHTVDAALERKLEIGKLILDQRDERETDFIEVNKRAIEKGIEEGSMFEAVFLKKHESVADCMYQGEEAALFSIEEEEIGVEEELRLEDINFGKVEHTDKLKEVENFQSGETEVVEVAEVEKKAVVDELGEVVELQTGETEVVEVSEGEKKAFVDGLGEVVELQPGETEVVEVSEGEKKALVDELGEVVELQTEETDELGEVVENLEYQDIETPENTESSKEYLISSLSEEHRVASDMLNSFEKQNEVVKDSVEEVYNEETGDMEMVESTMEVVGNFTNLAGEVITEKMNSDRTVFGEILNLVSVGNLSKELIKHMETEIALKVLLGLFIFSMIVVASLVLGFQFKKKNTLKKDSNVKEKPCSETVVVEPKKFIGKNSSLPSKPYSEFGAAEKCRPVRPIWGAEEALEQIYSFNKSPSSSIHSTEEAPEENHQCRAPTVEFLSEIVVREVSSSLRISSIKKKTNESEESNYSVSSQRKISRSNGNSVSVRAQPTHSEFSIMESPSYGSYTTEQKIVMKKEEDRDGEVKVITTPLRRSSRIRSRSAMSP